MARFYLWLKVKHINQILFITDIEEAQRVKKEMETGKRKIDCDLEKAMIKDIKRHSDKIQKKRAFKNLNKKIQA